MPAISIIVPIYKVEKYVKKCLQSLATQTLQDIEIILVDDGSPDSCGDICDKYANLYNTIRVIHQENKGVSVARNVGMAIAKGKWISFVDGDDWVEIDMFEKILTLAENHDCDICIGAHFVEREHRRDSNRFNGLDGYILTDKDKYALFTKSFSALSKTSIGFDIGMPWARLYRKSFIDENNVTFVPNLSRSQDYIFNLYAFQLASKIILIDLPLYHYRVFSDSVGNRYNPNFFDITNQIIAEYICFFNKYYSSINISSLINHLVATYMIRSTRLQFIPNESHLSFSQRIYGIKKIIKSEPYKTAICNVDLKSLALGKRIPILLLRIGLVRIFFFFLKFVHWYKLQKE